MYYKANGNFLNDVIIEPYTDSSTIDELKAEIDSILASVDGLATFMDDKIKFENDLNNFQDDINDLLDGLGVTSGSELNELSGDDVTIEDIIKDKFRQVKQIINSKNSEISNLDSLNNSLQNEQIDKSNEILPTYQSSCSETSRLNQTIAALTDELTTAQSKSAYLEEAMALNKEYIVQITDYAQRLGLDKFVKATKLIIEKKDKVIEVLSKGIFSNILLKPKKSKDGIEYYNTNKQLKGSNYINNNGDFLLVNKNGDGLKILKDGTAEFHNKIMFSDSYIKHNNDGTFDIKNKSDKGLRMTKEGGLIINSDICIGDICLSVNKLKLLLVILNAIVANHIQDTKLEGKSIEDMTKGEVDDLKGKLKEM